MSASDYAEPIVKCFYVEPINKSLEMGHKAAASILKAIAQVINNLLISSRRAAADINKIV